MQVKPLSTNFADQWTHQSKEDLIYSLVESEFENLDSIMSNLVYRQTIRFNSIASFYAVNKKNPCSFVIVADKVTYEL